jgi:hypothetical protein
MGALEHALRSSGSSPKMSLPPLPVGVPTIRRSSLSIDQITKREAPKLKSKKNQSAAAKLPPTIRTANNPRGKNKWGIIVFAIFLLLGIGGWYLLNSGIFPMKIFSASSSTPMHLPSTDVPAQPTQTVVSASATPPPSAPPATPTSLLASPTPVEATVTSVSISPATFTATAEVPTSTSVAIPLSPTPTFAPTSAPTAVSGVPTIRYPNGFHFTLFWNDTSFHLLNRAGEKRSMSPFKFERLDASGQPTDSFSGYLWENNKFTTIPPKTCVSIKIYGDNDPPYISPPDCERGYISIVQPRKDEDRMLFFWNPKEGSAQFRVLWMDEEVARCEISTEVCEVYIP